MRLRFAGLLLLAACQYTIHDSESDPPSPDELASHERSSAPSCDVTIDRSKELLVTHRSVLLDRRARNDVPGSAFSFRTRLEELAGSPTAAPALIEAWLDQWRTITTVGPNRAPVEPRPHVEDVLAAPWRAYAFDPAYAPFRLLAIVNRLDLRTSPDACSGDAGQLRFVYTATNGTSSIPMTVIVEIPYPRARTPQEWARAWHDLASLPFGDAYVAKLADLTTAVTSRSPPASWTLRTNEVALGARDNLPWELREFALSHHALVQIPIATTPRLELDDSKSLDTWATDNRASILAGTFILPSSFQAGAASIPNADFRWASPSLDESLRRSFSMGTCNGCHGGESRSFGLRFQHLAPPDAAYYGDATNGETRVSEWLTEDLARREKSVASALCSTCQDRAPTGRYF
jgi:hypothetical protein